MLWQSTGAVFALPTGCHPFRLPERYSLAVVDPRCLGGLNYHAHLSTGIAVAQVIENRTGKQQRALGDITDSLA